MPGKKATMMFNFLARNDLLHFRQEEKENSDCNLAKEAERFENSISVPAGRRGEKKTCQKLPCLIQELAGK